LVVGAAGRARLSVSACASPARSANAETCDQRTVLGDILTFGFWARKQGYREWTVRASVAQLKAVSKRTNILEPEVFKEYLASNKLSESRKERLANTLAMFYKWKGIPFDKPRYRKIEKLPFIPLESEIEQLVSGMGKKTASLLQLLRETGMRCGEGWNAKWADIDFERSTITVRPEKNSNSRVLKISNRLIAMLNRMPRNSSFIFHDEKQDPITSLLYARRNFERQRKRLAAKLQNYRLMQIHFHTLRHYFATMTYHRTRDVLYTKHLLGHRSLIHTLRYVQLVNFESDDFVVKIATDKASRVSLLEEGFELIGQDGNEWYLRKRK
jgi:integrase